MPNLERCSYDALMQRDLFMLELASPNELPRRFDVGSKYFGTFIAWDSRAATHDEVASFVKTLIDDHGLRRFVLRCSIRGHFQLACWRPATDNKSWDASGGSVFRIKPGAAMLD